MPIKKRSVYREGITSRVLLAMDHLVTENLVVNESDLIKQMSITHTTVYRWKARRNAPTIDNISFLCHRYQVSPEFIISGRGRILTHENELKQEMDAIYGRITELTRQLEQIRQKPGKTLSNVADIKAPPKRKPLKVKAVVSTK